MRELMVWLGTTLGLLIPFFLFVALGWPGDPDPCVTEVSPGRPNTCYCESFEAAEIGEPGIRQPFSTLSNLYSVITGAILAGFIYSFRSRGFPPGANRMRSTHFYPLLYLGVVIFLGLGSMWFHASLVRWGGVFDNLSMYAFANFLWFYTLVRITDNDLVFHVGYPTTTVLFTVLNALGIPGFVLVGVVAAVYLVLELCIAVWMPKVRASRDVALAFYLPAILSFLTAMLAWSMSQTGGKLCSPDAVFQWHGVWHWGAGATAMLLYFYWRRAQR